MKDRHLYSSVLSSFLGVVYGFELFPSRTTGCVVVMESGRMLDELIVYVARKKDSI
jgi:hypothetical protein